MAIQSVLNNPGSLAVEWIAKGGGGHFFTRDQQVQQQVQSNISHTTTLISKLKMYVESITIFGGSCIDLLVRIIELEGI